MAPKPIVTSLGTTDTATLGRVITAVAVESGRVTDLAVRVTDTEVAGGVGGAV